MRRRRLLSVVSATCLGGCVAGGVGSRDWAHEFSITERPTSGVDRVGVEVTFTDRYATASSPPSLSVTLTNETNSRVFVQFGGAGIVHPRRAVSAPVRLYSSEVELEHTGNGAWLPSDPESIPEYYVLSIVSKPIPVGEALTRRYRLGLTPDANRSGYPTGSVVFDAEPRTFDSLDGTVDLGFAVDVRVACVCD